MRYPLGYALALSLGLAVACATQHIGNASACERNGDTYGYSQAELERNYLASANYVGYDEALACFYVD